MGVVFYLSKQNFAVFFKFENFQKMLIVILDVILNLDKAYFGNAALKQMANYTLKTLDMMVYP